MNKLTDLTSGTVATQYPMQFTWYAIAVTIIVIILVIVLITVSVKCRKDGSEGYGVLGPTYPNVPRSLVGGSMGAGNIKDNKELETALASADTGITSVGSTGGATFTGIPGKPQV